LPAPPPGEPPTFRTLDPFIEPWRPGGGDHHRETVAVLIGAVPVRQALERLVDLRTCGKEGDFRLEDARGIEEHERSGVVSLGGVIGRCNPDHSRAIIALGA
jgi:hypothetical protein